MTYQRLAASSTSSAKRAIFGMKKNKTLDEKECDELIKIADEIKTDVKFDCLQKIIKTDNSKFLIFTEFYATQDYLKEKLNNLGYDVTLFNGKMSPEEKQESIKNFKTRSQIMISTGAGGEGQNFQFCHNVVNYDLPWNPMQIGRAHV